MKTQTYILYIEDAAGNMKDFYRFSYKRAAKVKDVFIQEVKKNRDFWLNSWIGCSYARLYATPDGYNKNSDYEWSIDLQEL